MEIGEANLRGRPFYTYVSPSAGAVASVSVAGGEAEVTPEQALPDDQIRDVSENTPPPPGERVPATVKGGS